MQGKKAKLIKVKEVNKKVHKKRGITASVVVGIIGAYIGAFMYQWIEQVIPYGNVDYAEILLLRDIETPVVIAMISGFLVCFFVSIRYLKFMQNRDWRLGFRFGPLFGGLAGGISGAITVIASVLVWWVESEGIAASEVVPGFPGVVLAGFVGGGFAGVVAGLILTAMFGYPSVKLLRRKPD